MLLIENETSFADIDISQLANDVTDFIEEVDPYISAGSDWDYPYTFGEAMYNVTENTIDDLLEIINNGQFNKVTQFIEMLNGYDHLSSAQSRKRKSINDRLRKIHQILVLDYMSKRDRGE